MTSKYREMAEKFLFDYLPDADELAVLLKQVAREAFEEAAVICDGGKQADCCCGYFF